MWYEKIYMVDYKLQRFLDAQQGVYNQALAEVKNGKKYSHWIWYIFPQLKGLGMSYNSQYYGICGKVSYTTALSLRPILRIHLPQSYLSVAKILLLFQKVIDLYFQGRLDETTKKILNKY